MTNGHKRGRVNPAASLELRMESNASLELRRERNRRYYLQHKAAKKPSSTNVAESTEAVASTFAANPSQMDATIPEIPQGQSASTPHIKMPSGHNTVRAYPSASLEQRNASSLELRRERNRRYYVRHKAAKKPSSTNVAESTEAVRRRECNRRYYVRHKAAKKPSSTNVAESTEAVASTFAANPPQMDATIPEIPQGQSASTPHIKMPSGHNTGRADPSASFEQRNTSLELCRERNRRYYVRHKDAKKPSSTNVAESTEAVASTFAANPPQMDATIPEIPQGQSASTPHIKIPSGHNTGRADPSASLERRRERNRRYYAARKAAKKSSAESMIVKDIELPYKKKKSESVGELPPRAESMIVKDIELPYKKRKSVTVGELPPRAESMIVKDVLLPYKKRKSEAVGELPPREEPMSSL